MKLEQLDGKRILHEKNKTIYVDIYTRKGYQIMNHDLKQYLKFENRYLIDVILAMLTLVFTGNILSTSIIGITSFIISELTFYFIFLKKLKRVEYTTKKKGLSDDVAEAFSSIVIIVFIILQLTIALGILYLAFHTIYEIVFYVLCVIASVFIYISIIYMIGLYKSVKVVK